MGVIVMRLRHSGNRAVSSKPADFSILPIATTADFSLCLGLQLFMEHTTASIIECGMRASLPFSGFRIDQLLSGFACAASYLDMKLCWEGIREVIGMNGFV